MTTYQTMQETLYHPEIGFYTTFGITASQTTSDQVEYATSISDVFLDKNVAENFVQMCNELKLDIIHLRDVIENSIA